ncbi:PilZ domain-containing protein [Desulfovibrio mangrovi]|uniref:PilZ domain-containing protein n=1 Tax=Desulfovibrio mangrovi TaxID=2976983 RepID=UPI00224535FF|nr:PilZ domain-containing protein [Desulfovibrio mangrovi]UZP65885.1 PilZ domain-containing protein [Desulfovibrio mangrovi]
MVERRSEPRVPLDCPVFATLQLKDGLEVYCLLRDLSLQGAQVALPPGELSIDVVVGDDIVILDPPVQLDGVITNARAQVAWVQGGMFGIRFANGMEIDQQLLEKLISDACM